MTDDWGWDESEFNCSVCGTTDVVTAAGPTKSPILVIAEFPGWEEIRDGKPLVGATGGVLKSELRYLGIDMKRFRLTNLWILPPNKNQDCLDRGAELAICEAKGRKAILLLGSDTVKYFCDDAVSDVTGLQVKSHLLSAPIIVACVQPATVCHQGVGELRNSLEKFAEHVDELL